MTEESNRNGVKRACDGCRIRKVRCSNTTPCKYCTINQIPCTFYRKSGTRGPQKLRSKTIQEIADVQRRDPDNAQQVMPFAESESEVGLRTGQHILPVLRLPSISDSLSGAESNIFPITQKPLPPLVASPPTGFLGSPTAQKAPNTVTPVASLVLQLCVYRLRMFPVWPIVAVEDLMAAIQKDSTDAEAYALANAVGAATVAQLKLSPLKNSAEVVTGESMEAEVQRIRTAVPIKLNNNRLRTSFFLHVYHENLNPGGAYSLLYLREAITIAQIMGLHRESSYTDLPSDEQQFRRRVLWLLFVTERGVAMLHKLPVILKPNVSFPVMEYNAEVSILPAFRKIVNLFWIFDQSGAFDILQNLSGSSSPERGAREASASHNVLTLLQKRLQEIPIDSIGTNDVQAADICVTQSWMRAVLWRMTIRRGATSSTGDQNALLYPTQIAREFLAIISKLPITAIEAHGPSMELKIYEIADAVVDSMSHSDLNTPGISPGDTTHREVLEQLQRILSSCRGGNIVLVERLEGRLARMSTSRPRSHAVIESSPRYENLWHTHNPQQHNHENGLEFRSDASTVALSDFSQPQQFASFPWDELAGEGPMNLAGFADGNGILFDNTESSAVLDRFLGDGLSDTWSIIRNTSMPVSQWL